MAERPSGTVTFLFTDVEGSTRLWAEDRAAMSASLEVHDRVLRKRLEAHGGYVFTTAGDSFAVAFARPSDAVAAAGEIQDALRDVEWPGPALRVRMGIHLGEADERDGDYFGPVVNTAARLEAAGHGGQVLVSAAVREAVGIDATDLGDFSLKDVPGRVRVWQLGDGEFPPLRSVGPRTNLPVPANRMLGRDDAVRAVRVLLAEHRLVTLTAFGGTGKTRLALAVADAELGEWRDGVWFADLTTAVSPDDVGATVAGALGLEVVSHDPVTEIARYVAGRRLLLVLDNCEHVIDTCAELVARVLAAGDSSSILATSREWLDVDGERVFQVPSLPVDSDDSPAVQLFVDRATAVEPDFELDRTNVEQVTELCQRLDGVPLAIELAAARSAVMSPAMLVEGLTDRFRLLSGGRRRRRGRTLEATIDWSYDLLEEDEQALFRVLGVFAGSFDLAAVAAVADVSPAAAADLVESLYGRSLVAAADGEGRFRLLETLKAYAEDRLVVAGGAEAARDRHARHFLEAARPESMLRARENFGRISRVEVDLPNFLVAADWLETGGRDEDLASLLYAIGTASGSSPLVSILPRSARCRERIDDRELVDQLHLAEMTIAQDTGDWGRFISACIELRSSSLPASQAIGHAYLMIPTSRLDPASALAGIEQFVELWDRGGPDEVEAAARASRLMVAAFSNELDLVRRMVPEVLDALERTTPLDGFWSVTVAIEALVAWVDGDVDAVRRVVDRITTAFPSLPGDILPALTGFLASLAVFADGAEPRAATAVRAHALDAVSGRMAHVESDALILLAELTRLEGELDRARDLLRSSSSGRNPASVFAGHLIADRLGIHAEIEAEFAANSGDPSWLLDRPRRALVAEIERRGWSEH